MKIFAKIQILVQIFKKKFFFSNIQKIKNFKKKLKN
jgi:hypothetical protein